ncbi:hypothetical protein GTW51_22935 [Aurantimonas aggregata]|uniref:Uncharacterized protein n=1 Tax=Aurantimonas aggregata TaxID=2047720 RepID=A0A6L9MPL9_9HYPH|nr:hypothetical protein [Aurantimonas aggregata]NDV89500.1 hypothetical protein [Aurantimonas aggregata]
MIASSSPADAVSEDERQIAWVLAHPGMSDWLKDALKSAADRDPVHLLNDLEILGLLLRRKSQAIIDEQLRQSPSPPS